MKAETNIDIVTAIIPILTYVESFSYNLIQNRKSRIQKVVLDNRIKYMDEIRNGFTHFIGLVNADAIRYAQSNKDVMKIYSESLFLGYGKIKTYIKPFYDIDKELLTALDNVYYSTLKMLNGADDEQISIDALREDFADKYLKYDWAYWKYIQGQKEGNYMDSDEAFDEVYYSFVKKVEKKESK